MKIARYTLPRSTTCEFDIHHNRPPNCGIERLQTAARSESIVERPWPRDNGGIPRFAAFGPMTR